jgi:hypothetical protein
MSYRHEQLASLGALPYGRHAALLVNQAVEALAPLERHEP